MSKASEAGKLFMAGVLAKLPEAARGQVEAVFQAAEADAALEVIGTGALAQPEINRRLDEARTKMEEADARLVELNNWYTPNSAALEEWKVIKPEYERLKAGTGNGNGNPNPSPKSFTEDDMKRTALGVVNDAGREYVGVSAWIAAKAVEHLHRFQEPLDTMALVANPKLGKPIPGQPDRVFSLNDAYQEAYGAKVAAANTAAEEARITKLVEDRLAEERKKFTGHPFPLASESTLPIDTLNDPNRPKHTIDSAVAEYDRLQAARGV